ncbi:Uncharacterised protein [Sphingomonas paucimobilis]|nr:Uncharacterised protein [Sphingomonas paucimobilis]
MDAFYYTHAQNIGDTVANAPGGMGETRVSLGIH